MIIRILSLILLSVNILFAQEKAGIAFQELSFQEALEVATREDKLIFIDAYAVWCGPCKKMDKDVFSIREVGDVYNQKFINLKIDMEKGEGIGLAQTYGVRAYPSFLFIDGNGEVAHREIGYQPAQQFIELANVASNPDTQMGNMSKKYNEGKRDPEFLIKYVDALMDVMDPRASEVISTYLKTQKDWNSDETRTLIMKSVESASDSEYNYIVENRKAFIKQFGEEQFEQKIYRSVVTAMMTEGDVSITRANEWFDKSYPENSEKLKLRFEMDYYRRNGDHKEFANAVLAFHKAYPITNAMELNSYAWSFYEHIDDKKLLKKGLKLAEESVSIWKQYENMDTLAALQFKLGKKKKAKKSALEAIALAEKMGIDPTDTKELLEKMGPKK